jgi:putative peptidoglycan lipid II flippase
MGIATFFSRIAGLLREQVFAYLFGAGHATDAFNVAFRIPNLLRDLFAEGAMSSALVPTFTEVQVTQTPERAWRVAGLVFRVLFVIATIISVLGMIFAAQLVELYASSYHAVPGKFELTVSLTQIMYPFFPLVALAAAFMGILNSCGRFFLPAFASALFNVTSICIGGGLALILPHYGISGILGMAYGVVAGGLVQAACQIPSLRRAGYRFPPAQKSDPIWYRDPALKKVLTLMIPGMVGLSATQVNVLVNTILATGTEAGAVSWLNYSFRLMQFPIGIFGVSLAAATLPRVTREWVTQNKEQALLTLETSLKRVFAINLPASAGLGFLGVPVIALLFQYGKFTEQDTLATASALAAYSIGLTAYSAVKILVPVSYAFGNARVPVISSILTVTFTIAFNLLCVDKMGFVGLALGTSLGAFFNMGLMLYYLQKILRPHEVGLNLKGLGRSFLVSTLLACIMGWVCFQSLGFFDRILGSGPVAHLPVFMLRAAKLGGIGVEALLIWVGLAKLFAVPEALEAFELFTNKLKKKLSPKVK